MAIGKINGPMLQPNLERQGQNIALDGDLTYWDVNSRFVGINTVTPSYALDVFGNAHLGNIYIRGNAITTDPGRKLNLGNISNITIAGGSANSIVYTDGLGNIAFGNLISIVALEGFSGNSMVLGTPTQGSFSTQVTLNSQNTVTDAIALINYALGNVAVNVASLTTSVYSNANVSSYLTLYTGNITANVVTANLYSGNINGFVNGNVTGNITGSIGTFGNITGNLLTAYQPYITTVGTLTNLVVGGNTTTGNATATGSFYGNIVADTISPYLTNVVVFTNQTAIKLPVGDESTRPAGIAGYFRYNSHLATVEYYNGTAWVPLNNSIIDQQIVPDGVNNSFTLTQTSTASGLLVSINGTMQTPGVAYTVSGTTISFAEIPQVTDLVDVRFIASAGTTTLDYQVVDTANIVVGTSNVIVDSFSPTLYRSAKYIISSSNGTDASLAEAFLVQNNGVTVINTSANVNTGSNYLTFYSNVYNGAVNFIVKGSTSSNKLRIQRTYINV